MEERVKRMKERGSYKEGMEEWNAKRKDERKD